MPAEIQSFSCRRDGPSTCKRSSSLCSSLGVPLISTTGPIRAYHQVFLDHVGRHAQQAFVQEAKGAAHQRTARCFILKSIISRHQQHDLPHLWRRVYNLTVRYRPSYETIAPTACMLVAFCRMCSLPACLCVRTVLVLRKQDGDDVFAILFTKITE
jgi:hypothetical protein